MTYRCPTSRRESDKFEMTQVEVAEKLFLDTKTIASTERRAIEKLKVLLEQKGITAQDILGD